MQSAQMYTPVKRRTIGKMIQRLLPRLRAAARAGIKRLPMAAAFFLLGLAQCFSVPSPYAVCCLAALLQAGIRPRGALMGLMAGQIMRFFWGAAPDAWQMIACIGCCGAMRIHWQRKWQLFAMTGMLLAGRALPGMMQAGNAQGAMLHGLSILMGLASMPALMRAAQLIRRKKQELSEDDLLCLMFPCLLVIAGAARLTLAEMNLGYILSCLAVLLLSWHAGGATGICGAMGLGLSLLLGGQSAILLVNLTIGALLAGLFHGKSRFLAALGFLLSGVTATYLTSLTFRPLYFLAMLTGTALFLLLPGEWMKKIGIFVRMLRWNRPRENAYTRLKMQKWVRAIDTMADALPHPRMELPEAEEESEALTEQLCSRCDRLPICWRDQYAATREGMLALAGRGEQMEEQLEIINHYFSACPRIAKIPEILNQLDEARLKKTQRAICAEYERDMLKTHLTALSQAAQRISLEEGAADEEEAWQLSQIEEALQAMRFPARIAFAKRTEGRLMICLKCDPLSLRPMAGEQLARQIGLRLQARLQVTEQQNGRILLEEEPPLAVYTGMATACAVTRERKSRMGSAPDNGDAVLVRPLPGGHSLLALSDGMGHGAGAQDESRKTLELLSLCMEAGYTRSQAMTAVNGMMLSATGGEKFATVDLCLIDLFTGEAAMNKLGACASVLFQGQKMQFIEGAALPLGIIEHVEPMEHHFTLGEGDMLLMMSDGITDAFAAEEEILSVLRRGRDDSPQHIADALLQEAMIQKDGLPPDDMTVLCARICQRRREKGYSRSI